MPALLAMDSSPRRAPTLFLSLLPVAVLIALLALSVYLFGDASSQGPNQIALTLAAGVAILIGVHLGYPWRELEGGIVRGISLSMGAMLILLVVGALIGTWILAGVVPSMIYYGLQVLSPSIFYAAACIICAFVSIATGSSWTTASTIGIALVGVATAQNLNLGLTAGAIISGAYFGDKMSPLSDTTNLAPAVAGTELFIHIRHMMWTTIPSLVLALVGFAVIGWMSPVPDEARDLDAILAALDESFVIGPHLLLPAVLVLALVWRRMPAFPALLIGALAGAVFAVIFQPRALATFVGETDLPRGLVLIKGSWTALFAGFTLSSGNTALDALLSRGGMASMLTTVWLILSAMMFGAVMETTKMLEKLAASVLSVVSSAGTLVAATLVSSAGMNVVASDQYIAIVLPGRMFRAEYRRRRLHPKNLSRALEDAGTLTSPLIPWNTCGAFMAQTLGVAAFTYLPYCFFNLLNPLVSATYGFTGFTIEPAGEDEEEEDSAA
jgi:NhaC family Na+:H+ antiporter